MDPLWADTRLPVRFWQRIIPNPITECWYWIGAMSSGGYGWYWDGAHSTKQAHRVSYEKLVGSIPVGLDLDHLCRIRYCVNPVHLEPVTRSENLKRGPRCNPTQCRNGHDYLVTGRMSVPRGTLYCYECKKAQNRERYRQGKE